MEQTQLYPNLCVCEWYTTLTDVISHVGTGVSDVCIGPHILRCGRPKHVVRHTTNVLLLQWIVE